MVWNCLYHLEEFPGDFLKFWDIHIWSTEDTKLEFFEHYKTTSGQALNPNMASGVTGQYRIDLFLIDNNNNLISRSNSDKVQHELCHARLFGTEYFVKGVHEKHESRDYFKINFWYWNRIWWKKFQLSILDIREYI